MLQIKNLIKEYSSGPLALNGVNLSVEEGEVVALIGSSGAGKSTLVRCINRLVEPTEGEIIFNDKNLCKLNKKELRLARRDIGMIFQEFALVERLTVMENVLSGRLGYVGFLKSALRKFPTEDIEKAYEYLGRVGLKDYVNTRADQLSGGERQRVGIARALIQQPMLLLVDEPTASLDPKTSHEIMKLIIELVKERNMTCIINIHDVVLAKEYTNRIIGLREGQIKYDDTSDNLTENKLEFIYGGEDWEEVS